MEGRLLSALAFILAALAIIVSPAAVAAGQAGLSITFSKPVYDRGDIVSFKVSGLQPPATVAVEVYSPDGQLVWVHQEDNIPYTEAVFSFKLPDTASDGVYTVYVAVEGSEPVAANFTVHRPEFLILSATISPSSAETGETVTVSVDVENVGAEGTFYIVVVGPYNSTVAQVGPLTLAYGERGSYQLSFTAPDRPGTFTYTVETVNVKYGTIDSTYQLTLAVHYPPPPPVVTTPYVPPPPPPTPTMTAPATTTKSATTTSPPANATQAFKAYIADLVSPNGVVGKPVKVVAPAARVEVTIPAGTLILGPTGTPVRPSTIVVTVLRQAPPVEPPNKLVGPAVDVRFEGYTRVTFNQSVMVTVPYNPMEVPPGYEVRLAYYDAELGKWVPLPTIKVDPFRGTVTGLTKHFTVFAAIAYRVVVPVTTTAVVTTTVPVTTTATTTVTTTVTAAPATTTVTKTATVTKTKPVTTTWTQVVVQPVTVTTVTERTVTTTSVKTVTSTTEKVVTVTASPTTVVSPTTVTKTKTPGWAYGALAVAVVFAVATIVLALRLAGRSGGS